MEQMEARGQFCKCLKENSQSKQAVNLSIYPEGRGEKEEIMLHCSRQPRGGERLWKKSTEFQRTGKKESILSFLPVF